MDGCQRFITLSIFREGIMPEIKKEQKAAAPCPLYKKCGGCQLQNLNYEEQLRWKERRMIGLMGQFGHVEPVIGMERPCLLYTSRCV